MKYKELPKYEKLMTTLERTIKTSWHLDSIHEVGIKKWLNNFAGDALSEDFDTKEEAQEFEQRLALFLLCNFVYYNENEVKHLMRMMLEKYIHKYMLINDISTPDDALIDKLIRKTRFSQLGNESESSAYMLYLYRQINELSKNDFEDKEGMENIVFVDDFSITGGQAERYIKKYVREHKEHKNMNMYVLLMVATKKAVKKIEKLPQITAVLPCILIDDTSKAFSKTSIVFQGYSPELKKQAKKMCQHYGELIMVDEEGATPLGFGGGEFMFGAYYNTPNNTIPIFWSEINNWKPFFKRYNKKYTKSSVIRLGGQYV